MQSKGFPGDRRAASIEKKPGSVAPEIPGKVLVPFCGSHNTFIVTDSQAAAEKNLSSYSSYQIDNVGGFSPLAGGVPEYARGEKPPILIGGSHKNETALLDEKQGFNLFDLKNLLSVDFHWLTISTGPVISKYLLENTEFLEEGGSRPGFKNSEKRVGWGGQFERHYNARQKEKRYGFGLDYESWVFPGESSRMFVKLLNDMQPKSKPTRLDIAFDFNVDSSIYPKSLTDLLRPEIERRRFGINAAGPEFTGTRYIGDRTSCRFLRIYRKDMESESWSEKFGPTLRIELELKGRQLLALWNILAKKGYQFAFRVAAAHVKKMISINLLSLELPELPTVDEDIPLSAVDKVVHLVNQYGIYIHQLKSLGVDLDTFCSYRAEMASYWSKYRANTLMKEMSGLDIQEFNQRVADVLMNHSIINQEDEQNKARPYHAAEKAGQ